jgi:hypothetical protein
VIVDREIRREKEKRGKAMQQFQHKFVEYRRNSEV